MSPRYSVLLPTHDRADVIGFAIRSVLLQTEQDFELLVVGDGCTDGTASVVQGFGDERIRWYDLPKAPYFGYANRNVALRQARGELVAFVAHDDLILPDHLELLGRVFESEAVEWAYSRPVWVADDGTMVPFGVDLRQGDQLDDFLAGRNTIPASCVAYRRTCVARYGYWPEDVPRGGDLVYWTSIVWDARGANIGYVPEATTLHFRASWKGDRHWGPPPLDAWLRLASDAPWWPPALRAAVGHGEPPQATLWRLVGSDRPGWSAAFRAGIALVMDRLAWSTARTLPGLVRAVTRIVHELTRAGSHQQALAIADEALAIAPADASLHHIRGSALLGAGLLVEAEAALRRAVELDDTVAAHHGTLSRALLRQRRPQEALAAVERAIALRPGTAALHLHRGKVLENMGRSDDARESMREALSLDPRLTKSDLHHVS